MSDEKKGRKEGKRFHIGKVMRIKPWPKPPKKSQSDKSGGERKKN